MATHGSADAAWFYVDGYQVAGVVTHLEDNQEALTDNNTGLGESVDHEGFVGVKTAEIAHDGFFDDAAASVISALDPAAGGALGAEHVLCYAIAGNVIGASCILVRGALEAKFKKLVERVKFTKANASYTVNTVLEGAKVIMHRAARAAAANTDATSVNNGASSANGGTAFLAVESWTGAPTSLAVTMRDSADNVTFAAIAGGSAFAAVTAANQAKVLTITGTIRQYVSAAWALTGGTAPSWTGIVALVRNP